MNLTPAAELAMRFEGLRLKPYLCPAGVATIGHGNTRYLDGRAVTLDDPAITHSEALELLLRSMDRVYLPALLRQCPVLIQHENRLNAMLDWVFNLGPGALQVSTLKRRINDGDWAGAAEEIPKWNKGGGRVLPGLVKRRAAERALFESAAG